MTILDFSIIAVVAALFVLALIAYKKKPRCTCGQDGGCCGNCAGCCRKYDAVSDNKQKTWSTNKVDTIKSS